MGVISVCDSLWQLFSRPISPDAFSLVRRVLSREWLVPRRKKDRPGVGRGDQGLGFRSHDSKPRKSCWNCRKEGHRMADCTTKRKSGPPGGQEKAPAQRGAATSGQQSSFQQSFKEGAGSASHASGKGA